MNDHKRHPAAHSGAPAAPPTGETSKVPLSPAATGEMKIAAPAQHPAPGCSPKHVAKAAAATKQ